MSVMTRHVMRLEHETRAARLHAEQAEKMRLALWRMESEANALLLLENTRGTKDFLRINQEQIPDHVRVYFQMDHAGKLQCMDGATDADQKQLQVIMKSPSASAAGTNDLVMCQAASGWVANSAKWESSLATNDSAEISQVAEKGKRVESYNRTMSQMKMGNIETRPAAVDQPETTWIAGNYRPLWLDGELFLVRALLGAGGNSMQGVWLRTDDLKLRLLGLTNDLFDDAELVPTETALSSVVLPASENLAEALPGEALALVSLPWKLQVSEEIDPTPIHHSPAMTALRFAWVGLTIAFAAGLVLVIGLMRLSERRATFVSSVTHELRTPLTTFQLYSDMLASGMVRDESKRQGYFETLRREADRLGHLVENVLAFAQVERGSARGGVREIAWQQIWPSIIERMKTRLEHAGLQLKVVMENSDPERVVRIDVAALEHILLNLTDNAAKYAQPHTLPEVVFSCRAHEKGWEICLRDFGPGIAASDRRKIFRAFHKSAQAAALSKPGVGLGLSLSKRLAKSMGADLSYRDGEAGGACFVLTAKWR